MPSTPFRIAAVATLLFTAALAGPSRGADKLTAEKVTDEKVTDENVPMPIRKPAESRKLADTEEYSVSVELAAPARTGEPAAVKLTVTPKKGWKLNREFPTKLTVEAPDGVTLARPEQSYDDAKRFDEKAGADWSVDFTAAAGEVPLTGKLRFAVCTAETCNPRRESLSFSVAVE